MKTESITAQKLANYSPLNHLIESHCEILTSMMEVSELDAGALIPSDISSLQYLVDGQVDIKNEDHLIKSVSSESEASWLPLNQAAGDLHIHASKPSQIIALDKDTVNLFLAWNEIAASQNFKIAELSNDYPQWAAEIMNNPAFEAISGDVLQAIFMNLEPVTVQVGEVIIKQGAAGEHYYVIAKGECVVTELGENKELVHLANLQAGQAFGEESLLSELPCNATVTMLTDGILLRIDKNNFNRLIKKSTLSWVTAEQCAALLKDGAKMIDIRQREEAMIDPVEAAINLPLRNLRKLSHELDRDLTYIVHNSGGMRGAAAAYLLAQRNFDVKALMVDD